MKESRVLPNELEQDSQGNYFLKIGNTRTIFTSHFDTACKDQVNVRHIINKNIIGTDKNSILGADDKAGVTIMLWLIKNKIPGLYYFFIGEEVGCIGSGLAAKMLPFKGLYDRVISFDRRGTTSVITHQSCMRTCSDEFADELAKQLSFRGLSYKKDDTGVYTDSAEFTSLIPECTNISVGYYAEHTVTETQDIDHLYRLAKSCLDVNWENLPTKRDITKSETKYNTIGKYHTSYNSYGYNKSSRSGSSWNRSGKVWNNSNFRDYDNDHYDTVYKSNRPGEKEEDDEYGDKFKKTRRGNSKRGKKYYDDGTKLVELEEKINHNKINKYESVKDKFLTTSLSKSEIEILRTQYFDMDCPADKEEFNTIVNSLAY